MLEAREDEFFYVTLMNENYAQPTLPPGVEAGMVKGLYRWAAYPAVGPACGTVRLLGSGTILREAIGAAELLRGWQVASEVWSATSFSELARDAREVERWNRLHPRARAVQPPSAMPRPDAPIVAASDYVCAWPQLIASYLPARFVALGTDGFGRSDTRSALRRFFEVDRHQIVLAALDALRERGEVGAEFCAEALRRYGIDADRAAPGRHERRPAGDEAVLQRPARAGATAGIGPPRGPR